MSIKKKHQFIIKLIDFHFNYYSMMNFNFISKNFLPDIKEY